MWVLAIVVGANAALGPLATRWLRRRGGSLRALGNWWLPSPWWSGAVRRLPLARAVSRAPRPRPLVVLRSRGLRDGFWAARRLGRVPKPELFLALVVALEERSSSRWASMRLAAGVAACSCSARSPAVLPLAAYFGASLGYLSVAGGGGVAPGFEGIVARRFLLSKSSSVLSTVTALSVVGVTLGVGLVIFALAVLAGFEYDLREKIIGATAHLVVQVKGGDPFLPDGRDAQAIDETPESWHEPGG